MYDAKTKKNRLRKICDSEYPKPSTLREDHGPQTGRSWRKVLRQIKMELQRKNFSERIKSRLQRPLQEKQKGQEGFSLVVIITLTPLFITALAVLSALSLSISQYHRGHKICRQQLLETQNQFILIIKKLTRLNPRAQALRRKRKQAKRKLKWAQRTANPKMIVAAKAYLAAVILKQMQHRAKQQNWMSLAQKIQIMARKEFSNIVRMNFKNSIVTLEPPKYKFAIVSKPSRSLTPDYLPQHNFEDKQRVFAKWNLYFKSILPPWISTLVSTDKTLTFQCSATIFRKENQWTPSLNADKSLLSF